MNGFSELLQMYIALMQIKLHVQLSICVHLNVKQVKLLNNLNHHNHNWTKQLTT